MRALPNPSMCQRRSLTGAFRNRGRGRGETGMTIVELMVAISVIAIIMSGLALSIGISYKSVALARSRQVAESSANKRLEELRDVDYADMSVSNVPTITHNTDPDNPDYFVSADTLNYDVTGTGQNEPLIKATDGITHVETPVTIGTTVVDIYQYVTWVDDPNIAGTQNLKRLSVVVKYSTVPLVGGSKLLRESVILTNGTVTLPDSGTTTTSSTTTTTNPSSTTTTTAPASACGTFSIAGSSGASTGYTSSTTVTITMALSGCPGTVLAGFSNDSGSTWSSDVTYSSSSPNLAWTLPTTDGIKTISGRVRNGSSGSYTALVSQSIILDTTQPTTPGSFARTVSCSGSTRTVTLSWSASADTYLVGYQLYRSTDGITWVLQTSTVSLSAVNTNSKTLTSVRYYVTGYDSAGNQSNASSTISLAKNQCS